MEMSSSASRQVEVLFPLLLEDRAASDTSILCKKTLAWVLHQRDLLHSVLKYPQVKKSD